MTKHELKPCPFCGETPNFNHGSSYADGVSVVECLSVECAIRPNVWSKAKSIPNDPEESSWHYDHTESDQNSIRLWNQRNSDPIREAFDEVEKRLLADSIPAGGDGGGIAISHILAAMTVVLCGYDGPTENEMLADHCKANNITEHSINADGFCNMGCC